MKILSFFCVLTFFYQDRWYKKLIYVKNKTKYEIFFFFLIKFTAKNSVPRTFIKNSRVKKFRGSSTLRCTAFQPFNNLVRGYRFCRFKIAWKSAERWNVYLDKNNNLFEDENVFLNISLLFENIHTVKNFPSLSCRVFTKIFLVNICVLMW